MYKKRNITVAICIAVIIVAAAGIIIYSNMDRGFSLIGTWESETGSVTHIYQDGTGKTEDGSGVHEFTWETISLIEAIERKSSIREYIRTIYGEEYTATYGEDGWGVDDFVLSLTFDDFPQVLDFPYNLVKQNTLMINTMGLGQALSTESNPSLRFTWITMTKTD